ncbi:peptidoglycan-binding protein [Patescibacteria group bacterium]|nr:peptidoglycan-binding protein [Patescibacteria group bacterium]
MGNLKLITEYILLSGIFFLLLPSALFAGNIVGNNQYAVFENPTLSLDGSDALKINFNPTNAVTSAELSTSGLQGQAWSSGAGWLQFSGTNYQVSNNCNSSTQVGTLSGYGWGEGTGWINFGPFSNNSQNVSVNQNGYLDGSAWSQNIGWISFDSISCPAGDGCVQFDFECPSSNSSQTSGIRTAACFMSASSQNISMGDSVELSWKLFGPVNQILLGNNYYQRDEKITVRPEKTTLYQASVEYNDSIYTCNITVTVDGQPPENTIEDEYSCKDSRAHNYNPLGRTHKQSLCTYEFNTCEDNDICNVDNIIESIDAEQCPYFNGYWKRGDVNYEVAKIQDFLNQYLQEDLVVDGIYGPNTSRVVGTFQKKHSKEILSPWRLSIPTNRWYKSTRTTANVLLGCLEDPVNLDNGVTSYQVTETNFLKRFTNFIFNNFIF